VSLAVVVALININKFHLRFSFIENGFILCEKNPSRAEMDFQEQINCDGKLRNLKDVNFTCLVCRKINNISLF